MRSRTRCCGDGERESRWLGAAEPTVEPCAEHGAEACVEAWVEAWMDSRGDEWPDESDESDERKEPPMFSGSSADGDVRSEVAEEHADGKARPNVEAGPREKGEEAVPASCIATASTGCSPG